MKGEKISDAFYLQEDVVELAQELLGKLLCSYIDKKFTSGIIVETEAYKAPEDCGAHAYRRTPRTEVIFSKGGKAYVYLIYGIYKLFNIVTNKQGVAHAILIRALEPKEGINVMMQRRGIEKIKKNITAGPGLFTQSLGIDLCHNAIDLNGDLIWIEDGEEAIPKDKILASARVGLNIAEPYKSIHWRFRIKDNPWTSPAK